MSQTGVDSRQIKDGAIKLIDLSQEVLDFLTSLAAVGPTTKFGSALNYTHFRENGTLEAIGQATTYDDLFPLSISAQNGNQAPNVTAIFGSGNIKAQVFPYNNNNENYNPTYQFPHRWKEQSIIIPHLHIAVPANNTANTYYVKFKKIYTWDNVDVDGTNPAPVDTEHAVIGTYTVLPYSPANPNAILSFGSISGSGKKLSSLMSCVIKRALPSDGDTYQANVWLKSSDIHIEQDTLGSDTEYTK